MDWWPYLPKFPRYPSHKGSTKQKVQTVGRTQTANLSDLRRGHSEHTKEVIDWYAPCYQNNNENAKPIREGGSHNMAMP